MITPAHSRTTTPAPPTPPPLPPDLATFPKAQWPVIPTTVPTPRVFTPLSQSISRTPPFKEAVGHTPVMLRFTQPPLPRSPPPPDPRRPFIPLPKELETHKSTVPADRTVITADVKMQVKDPYDELLSMILDDSTGKDVGESTKLSRGDSEPASQTNESKSKWFELKAGKSRQPAGKPPTVSPAGSSRLDGQFHKPVTMEPLTVIWEGPLKSDDEPVTSQRWPSVKGKGYTELFIEEEGETLEDKEEDARVMNGRLNPQVGLVTF